MKFAIFTILAVAAFASTQASIMNDFEDIGKLIPVNKIKALVAKHVLLDKEFQQFTKFLSTPEFAEAWEKLLSNDEFRTLVDYVGNSGYDVVSGLNKLAKLLKVKPYPTEINEEDLMMPRTVMSFLKDLLATFPKDKIQSLMKEKMSSSADWKKFINHLTAPAMQPLVDSAMNAPGTADVRALLKSKGVHLEKVIAAVLDVLSWSK